MDLRFVFIVFLLKWTYAQGKSISPVLCLYVHITSPLPLCPYTHYVCVCVSVCVWHCNEVHLAEATERLT